MSKQGSNHSILDDELDEEIPPLTKDEEEEMEIDMLDLDDLDDDFFEPDDQDYEEFNDDLDIDDGWGYSDHDAWDY